MPYQPSRRNGLIAIATVVLGFLLICAALFTWAMFAFTSEEDCYSGGFAADDPICQRVLQDNSQ